MKVDFVHWLLNQWYIRNILKYLNETKKEGSEYLAERNLIVLRQDTKGRIRIGGVLTQVEEGGFKLEKKAAELAVLDKCIRLQG